MRVRLTTPDEVADWQAEISAAVTAAEAAMRRSVAPDLAAAGLTWSSTTQAAARAQLWSPDRWAAVVDAEIRPAAEKVARQVAAALSARVDRRVRWAAADPVEQLVAMIVDKAIAAGDRLGSRLGLTAASVPGLRDPSAALDKLSETVGRERYGGVVHEDAGPTVLDEFQARFSELDKLASRAAAHLSDAAAQVLADTASDQRPGVQYTWVSMGDDATRDSHADADGQTVNAGDSFEVGGEELLFPGDPNGSDAETDNCRCWLEVEGVDLDRDFERSLMLDIA